MTVLVNIFLPLGIATFPTAAALAIAVLLLAAKVVALAVVVALIETTNAKLRFFRVPELMAASLGLGFLALAMRFL
jgi:formate hydrogenlyase subunit 4